MNESPTVFQCIFFGALGLLALVPVLVLICKSPTLREFLAELFGRSADDIEADRLEARDSEAEHRRMVAAYYQLMFGQHYRRKPCLALRLVAWREDVRRHVPAPEVLTTKLQQIQISQLRLCNEPPQLAVDGLTRQPNCARDTVLCGDEEEEKVSEA